MASQFEGVASLKDLTYSLQYRSDQHLLARDLYDYCLPSASTYYRAVGFFSSGVFQVARSAFYQFFKAGGKMLLVCSPHLDVADIEALKRGYRDRFKYSQQELLELFDSQKSLAPKQISEVVSWLVARRHLDVKIALVKEARQREIYHEKLGIFEDCLGNLVAFAGSANESYSALNSNFEAVDLFRSWEDTESKRVKIKKNDFDALWHNQTHGLEIHPFPEAIRLGLIQPREVPPETTAIDSPIKSKAGYSVAGGLEETLGIPIELKLRPHQIQALKEWFAHKGQGLLEMATGSGKTKTALAIASKLYEIVGPPLQIVIVCPYLHLVQQWLEEMREFGLEPLVCAESRNKWYSPFSTRLYNLASGQRLLSSVITSNATYCSDAFQQILQQIKVPMLFIADEAHNLGAPRMRQGLPQQATYRLGLSATPERWFDEEGTQALFDYFGPKLVRYTLEQALKDGVLCPYRYHPLLIDLTEEEYDVYCELTAKIARLTMMEDSLDNPSEILERLMIKRARLIATAQNKLNMLEFVMRPLQNTTHNLIYCGDGSVEEPSSQEISRQIDAATRILGHGLHMKVNKYTAETPSDRRKILRTEFANGDIQGLVAIRCLDEGVDIPETKRAFILASSTNPRQFVQRRGRLLRRAPGKEMAEIYDFLIQPPADLLDPGSEYYTVNQKLFRRELGRAVEFASLAVNGPEALRVLYPIQSKLKLLDIDGEVTNE